MLTISGFYTEKDGQYVNNATDENAEKLITAIDDIHKKVSAHEKPLFKFIRPEAKSYHLLSIYLSGKTKKEIFGLSENKIKSPVIITAFSTQDALSEVHYAIKAEYMNANAHAAEIEIAWYNDLFKKIMNNSELHHDEKIEILAHILFIDINARSIKAGSQWMSPIGVENYINKIIDSVTEIKDKTHLLAMG